MIDSQPAKLRVHSPRFLGSLGVTQFLKQKSQRTAIIFFFWFVLSTSFTKMLKWSLLFCHIIIDFTENISCHQTRKSPRCTEIHVWLHPGTGLTSAFVTEMCWHLCLKEIRKLMYLKTLWRVRLENRSFLCLSQPRLPQGLEDRPLVETESILPMPQNNHPNFTKAPFAGNNDSGSWRRGLRCSTRAEDSRDSVRTAPHIREANGKQSAVIWVAFCVAKCASVCDSHPFIRGQPQGQNNTLCDSLNECTCTLAIVFDKWKTTQMQRFLCSSPPLLPIPNSRLH